MNNQLSLFDKEEWRPLASHPNYSISRSGVIKRSDGSIASVNYNREYPRITIQHKTYLIHRLVAYAFCPNPLNKPEVNHKDHNKNNYHADNLEWVTHAENMHSSRRLITAPTRKSEFINIIEGEKWRTIIGAENNYMVSDFGRVVKKADKTIRVANIDEIDVNDKLMVVHQNESAYLHVRGYENGVQKNWKIHRLVATAFIPNPLGKPQVNHVNGIRNDNRCVNLEWVTQKENNIHSIKMYQSGTSVNINKLFEPKVSDKKQRDFILTIWNDALAHPNTYYKAELARKYNRPEKKIRELFSRKSWNFLTHDLPAPIFKEIPLYKHSAVIQNKIPDLFDEKWKHLIGYKNYRVSNKKRIKLVFVKKKTKWIFVINEHLLRPSAEDIYRIKRKGILCTVVATRW
jgi:hypothetical protein